MPVPLTVKRPATASPARQLLIGVVVLGPLFLVWQMWNKHQEIHFENPWLNICAHAGLVVFPLVWAWVMVATPFQFKETDETVLGTWSFFDTLSMSWWMWLMMWPAPVFGTIVLVHDFLTKDLTHPTNPSTS